MGEPLKGKIESDLKDAMKGHDAFRLSVLRMALAALRNKEIEKRGRGLSPELSDEEANAVLRSEMKKRKDAAEEFSKGGRQELAEKERQEAELIAAYLPQELSDSELQGIVAEAMKETGASSEKDFGKVMGAVTKKAAGRVSGGRAAEAVRRVLTK